ncbi:dihydroxyacetone kinase subunit DhaK [Metabacillus arenae]|uniref:Dihydroxyacetone kinase subunit DhaK n=1 Tax=Metabacillus arenae TaxID=2771434 RepID=A0A926NL66_9BACI|nr:dihydroxyacetone kinase subunit DhaK [Metabacillus arenae]MBD1381998.1 dihydroxyacetone kinase subunit DhaK [Metabacillus arenae]
MKKFINDPDDFVDEMLEGILLANPNHLRSIRDDNRGLVRIDAPVKNKVAIVTGGGSGHLPLFLGYVGKGMLDGASVGEVFAASSVQQMLDVTRAVDGGEGVLYVYGNYSGDVMNFEMAAELAETEGIRVESVVARDDVGSMPKEFEDQRRGVAGIFYLYKIASAKAATGASLDEVKAVTEKVNNSVRSIGVALSPCILPSVGKPNFKLGEDEMEIGMGIHGEPGIKRGKIDSADKIAESLVVAILEDLYTNQEIKEVSVLVNGLGSTPLEELYVVYRKIHHHLENKGIKVYKVFIGEYATSLEMTGLSVSLLNLDEELKDLLDMPFETPFHVQQ